MQEEDYVCEICDSEFTIKHFEEDQAVFCPFCGETLSKDLEEEIDPEDWNEDE
jgi:DNA-directed RNA polymerase subunit RPC12/RpoP